MRRYVDDDQGFLNFFQLNLIAEGLYNANFDPNVFFFSAGSTAAAETAQASYSIGRFVSQIAVPATGADLFTGAADAAGDRWKEAAAILRSTDFRTSALRAFVTSTIDISLLPQKWRLERCRRALLDDLLGVVHRRQPVDQVESPDMNGEGLRGVSEMQVRGYVMLMAAKMPLFGNVGRYLSEFPHTFEGLRQEIQAWRALTAAIDDNVVGLERTIAQSSRDRLLYEEEQVRAEQEAAGEMVRLREREGHEAADEASFGAAEVLLAFVALVFTVTQVQDINGWALVLVSALLLLLSPAAIFLLHQFLFLILEVWRYRKFHQDPLDGRFLYEADVRVDAPLDVGRAENFLGTDRLPAVAIPTIKELIRFRRNSYRVERVSPDEAIHKIHYEAIVRWDRTSRLWWRRRHHEMLLHLTYEVMFHRPSEEAHYVLRGIRALGTMGRRLSSAELQAFRLLISEAFVNDWAPDAIRVAGVRRDSLLALQHED